MSETIQPQMFASVDQLPTNVQNMDPVQPDRTAGLLSRLRTSRLGQVATVVVATLSISSANLLTESDPAQADSGHVYTVTGTGGEGVWLHSDPGLGDTGDLIKKMPDGTRFDAECYVNDTPIGDRNNPVWLYGTDDQGDRGYFTDVYSSSRWSRNNTLEQQGLPTCGDNVPDEEAEQNVTRPEDLQPAETVPVFVSYDRERAANWALAHAKDTPPNAGSCTWFVSNALWKGGVRETSSWNDNRQGLKRDGVRYGTDKAWRTPDFLNYMKTLPYIEVDAIDFSGDNENHLPDAKLGDAIIYDWDGDGSMDHAALITGFAANNSEYPLVSGWSEDGSRPNKYTRRGWTWSEKSQQFIQNVQDEDGDYPNKNMQAYLIQVRSEDDINVGQ